MIKNINCPCIIIATTSCIGNVLYCADVTDVIHVGFPSSIVGAIQEMGLSGTNTEECYNSKPLKYYIHINVDNYVYLNRTM